jgi:predicted class III extradiol MEMO1 family dioxygenase
MLQKDDQTVCMASVLLGMWHDETRRSIVASSNTAAWKEQANVEESDRRTSESPQTLTNPPRGPLWARTHFDSVR